jgi:hypothetical protein
VGLVTSNKFSFFRALSGDVNGDGKSDFIIFNGDGKTDFLFVWFIKHDENERIATHIIIRTALQNVAGSYDISTYESNLDHRLSNF